MARDIAAPEAGSKAARLRAWTLDALYPPVCVACGAEAASAGGLCGPCFRETPFLSGAVCDRCGAPVSGGSGAVLSDAAPFGAAEAACCESCLHAPPAWGRGRAAALYEGPARRAVLALKHGDRHEVAPAAARWMARGGAALLDGPALIAPVPLHWTRLARRRFNQSAELARALAARLERRADLALDLLVRARRTPSQEGRDRGGRIANVAGAFRVSRRWRGRVAGRRVVLIDDVMTTGATLSACVEALRAEGAEADALVLCRVARGDQS